MKLDHLGLVVADLYASELFYRKVFGFEPVYCYVSRNTPGLTAVFLRRGTVELELLHYADRSQVASPDHLALDCSDVDGEFRRLSLLGVGGLEPPRNTGDGYREMALRDPDGRRIELCTRIRPAPTYPIRAVIFDLDGTLIDSEGNYYEADRQVLAAYGVTLTREMKERYVGRSNLEVLRAFKAEFAIPDSAETLVERKNQIYLDLARRQTHVFPPMLEFLERLEALGLPLAIASGTSPDVLEAVLEGTGLGSRFAVAVSADVVGRSKPSPDVFLETARRLGVDPVECLVVEDSQFGVEAAHRALMPCIAVPSVQSTPLPDAFAMADLLFAGGIPTFDPAAATAWVQERLAR